MHPLLIFKALFNYVLFFKNGPIPASFSLHILLYAMSQFKFKFYIDKSVDGVLGIHTRGARIEGADESTELQHMFVVLVTLIPERERENRYPNGQQNRGKRLSKKLMNCFDSRLVWC